jgi:hypothetical protein
MSEDIRIASWTPFLEEYFASTGEKAHCLSWIHKQSEQLYSKRTTFIDLPVIVLSGVLGFLSVGSSSMFRGDEMIASISVGIGSLFVSVLNTIGSYFQWAKRAEGHRIASIQYAKLYRFLLIEMSLPREERMNPNDLLKLTKETYDRLQEISPLVPPEVVDAFRKKFGDPKYADISRPEETNGLEKITIYSEPTENHRKTDALISKRQDILSPLPSDGQGLFGVNNPIVVPKISRAPPTLPIQQEERHGEEGVSVVAST